jgi:hypothetical protein
MKRREQEPKTAGDEWRVGRKGKEHVRKGKAFSVGQTERAAKKDVKFLQ